MLHPKSGWAAVEPLGSGFPRQANCGELGHLRRDRIGLSEATHSLGFVGWRCSYAPVREGRGGDESHPFEARTIARIPARIAPGRLDQTAANSASSGAAGAVGSTFSGLGFSSGKSVSGNGLNYLVFQLGLHYRI